MCGLTAIFDSTGTQDIDAKLLNAMTDSLVHRGPEARGTHLDKGIGLGHRRLRIIDVEGGIQPMYAQDDQVVLVFNGEIYNFQEIAEELVAKGVSFDTRSDTEVILKSWITWGTDCCARFEGMFTIIIWDARDETFFMARDRLGKKPLYYAVLQSGELIVGSELKALKCHPDFDRTLDRTAVEDFFAFGYVPEPKSIFKGAQKLPAAHWLKWQRGSEMEVASYWTIPQTERDLSADETQQALRDHLQASVTGRLIADVPLGAFLSGGVDSSIVVAAMSDLSSDPVKTFSIGFDHKDYDESDYAAQIAEKFETDHHLSIVDPDDFSLIDRMAEMFDEPFGDASALPTFRVCEAARKDVTVCLSGDGGDEVFGGYRRHRFHVHQERVKRWMPLGLRRAIFGTLASLYPKADWAPRFLRAKSTLKEIAATEEEAYFHSVSAMNDEDRNRILSDGFRASLKGYRAIDTIKKYFAETTTKDPLRRAQYVDLKTWLPGDILVKADRTSMAVSLEVRAPFLDYRLVEFGLGLPAHQKISGKQGKAGLKAAFEDRLPHDILYRPKQGFSVPLAAWFRGPLKDRMLEVLQGERLAQTGFFNMDALAELGREHASGRRDHARTIWLIFVFDIFLKSLEAPQTS